MTRLKGTILGNQVAFAKGRQAPMVDPSMGGQFGAMPDLTTINSDAPQIKQHGLWILLDAPRGFADLDNPDKWRASLKALMEVHPKSISGFRSTLNAEYYQKPIGGTGENLHAPSDMKRDVSAPTWSWIELYGYAINTFLEGWMIELIMDPATKKPGVIARGKASPTDMLPDYWGASGIFIEPDATGKYAAKAYLSTGMGPKVGGESESGRDLNSPQEGVEYSVEFTATTQVGKGVLRLAQKLLDEIQYAGANSYNQEAFSTGVSADVAAANGNGYREKLADAAKTYVS